MAVLLVVLLVEQSNQSRVGRGKFLLTKLSTNHLLHALTENLPGNKKRRLVNLAISQFNRVTHKLMPPRRGIKSHGFETSSIPVRLLSRVDFEIIQDIPVILSRTSIHLHKYPPYKYFLDF